MTVDRLDSFIRIHTRYLSISYLVTRFHASAFNSPYTMLSAFDALNCAVFIIRHAMKPKAKCQTARSVQFQHQPGYICKQRRRRRRRLLKSIKIKKKTATVSGSLLPILLYVFVYPPFPKLNHSSSMSPN